MQTAALERALRFAYGASCAQDDSWRLDNSATQLGYALEIVQRDAAAWGANHVTPRGIALVLSWGMAHDLDSNLGHIELTMCLTDEL